MVCRMAEGLLLVAESMANGDMYAATRSEAAPSTSGTGTGMPGTVTATG